MIFYAIPRAALPDMGAAEFAGSATDAAGPAISYTNIPNQNCALQPVLSASISDISGVNTNPGTALAFITNWPQKPMCC
ncbi:MAG: hypothetical protein IPN26_03895 [Bacteroidetes bacterium]|nr:hypothetical protein [Bacteroidota bacterium]